MLWFIEETEKLKKHKGSVVSGVVSLFELVYHSHNKTTFEYARTECVAKKRLIKPSSTCCMRGVKSLMMSLPV